MNSVAYEYRCYVVKEVGAPAGYVTPASPDDLTAVKVQVGKTDGFDVEIENTPRDWPALPLTGAQGQLLMMIGGVALVLVGGGLYLVRRKRQA